MGIPFWGPENPSGNGGVSSHVWLPEGRMTVYIYGICVSERSAVIKHLSEDLYGKSMKIHGHEQFDCWLVVWNIFYFSIYWECHNPNWLSYFSEGWLNHQPDWDYIALNDGDFADGKPCTNMYCENRHHVVTWCMRSYVGHLDHCQVWLPDGTNRCNQWNSMQQLLVPAFNAYFDGYT